MLNNYMMTNHMVQPTSNVLPNTNSYNQYNPTITAILTMIINKYNEKKELLLDDILSVLTPFMPMLVPLIISIILPSFHTYVIKIYNYISNICHFILSKFIANNYDTEFEEDLEYPYKMEIGQLNYGESHRQCCYEQFFKNKKIVKKSYPGSSYDSQGFIDLYFLCDAYFYLNISNGKYFWNYYPSKHNKSISQYLNKTYSISKYIKIKYGYGYNKPSEHDRDFLSGYHLIVYTKNILYPIDIINLLQTEIINIYENLYKNYPKDLLMKISDTNNDCDNNYVLERCYNEHTEHIKTIIKKYIKFLETGGRNVSCNFCFSGEPGTGKTYVARAIANELKRQVVPLNLNKFEYEDDLFEFVFETNDYKKSVYLIDEIDMVCPDRELDSQVLNAKTQVLLKSFENNRTPDKYNELFSKLDNIESKTKQNNNENENNNNNNTNNNNNSINELKQETNTSKMIKQPLTLRSLLTLISGEKTPKELVIIGTTNNNKKLDEALIRPGRVNLF